MGTIQFPDRDKIEQQAAAWVSEIDCGMDLKQEAKLAGWLSKSPLHGEVFIQAASMWDVLDVLTPIAKILPIETENAKALKISNNRMFSLALGIGLVLIGVLLNANIITLGVTESNLLVGTESALERVDIKTQVFVTEVGERSNITLDDGSEIKLNTDTVISVKFSDRERRIELSKGEAFFQVAKNPNRPFVVLTASNRVTAVGTAFSIDVSNVEEPEVLVTEGRVKVDRLLKNPLKIKAKPSNEITALAISAPPVFLSQGQKILLSQNGVDKVTYTDDFDSALAWREGMIVFTGETLDQAIREIDRYIALDFKIVDKEITSIPVGGFFKTGDLDQLLLVLEGNFGVISERKGDQILLSKAP